VDKSDLKKNQRESFVLKKRHLEGNIALPDTMFLLLSSSGISGFYILAEIALFLLLTYLGGRCCKVLNLSPLLGEIIVGIVLGPEVLNAVPYAGDRRHDNTVVWEGYLLPNIWSEIGTVGVTLMIMESGMHLNFKKLVDVWKGSLMVGVLGTILPIITSILFVGLLFDGRFYPDGLAAGVALAPTSVGIAIKLLEESEQLSSMPGQTILAAAFMDDIFSLVALVILITLSEGEVTAGSIAIPVCSAFGFVGIGAWLSNAFMPKLSVLFSKVKPVKHATLQPKDELQLVIMAVVLSVCSYIGALIGSHLLGAFVAGMLFVNVPRSTLVWRRQLKRYIKLSVRVFFSATVAFSMPLSIMFSWEAFWKGLVLGMFPCIASKILASVVYRERSDNAQRKRLASLLVGVAMVGRGEFAYFVAKVALGTMMSGTGKRMLGQDIYACVLWALLCSTIFAPVLFKKVLRRYVTAQPIQRSKSIGGNAGSFGEISKRHFNVRLIGKHHTGVFREILNVLHDHGLDVIEAFAETDGVVDADVFTVEPRGKNKDLDDNSLSELEHAISEALDDPTSVVIFEPVVANDVCTKAADYVLEIEVMGDHHPDVLHEITDALARLNLDISKAFVETRMSHHEDDGQTSNIKEEVEVFYASTQNEVPLTPQLRATVREEIMAILGGHQLRGETFVKVVHKDACKLSHSFVTFQHDEAVAVIKCSGTHRKELLHEICDLLALRKLDVLKAELDHHGKTDENVFFVEPETVWCGEEKTQISRFLRQQIREDIMSLYASHHVDCSVSVRPLLYDGSSSEDDDTVVRLDDVDTEGDILSTGASSPRSPSEKTSESEERRRVRFNVGEKVGWDDVKASIYSNSNSEQEVPEEE
jgi:Kef-type K+ transport system membrane component KefB/glycine cleavage system regulatory protein